MHKEDESKEGYAEERFPDREANARSSCSL